jgi:hypothetical protein
MTRLCRQPDAVGATIALTATPAPALTLAIDADVPSSTTTSCAGVCDTKSATAFFAPTVITTASPAFGFYQGAFDNWNAGNAPDQRWTLVRGGDLGTAALYLSLTAHATDTINSNDPLNRVAGAQIAISANSLRTPGALATPTWLDGFTWSQAVHLSYVTPEIAARGITGGYYGLDYTTACGVAGVSCGPAYPYQYTTNHPSTPGVVNGLFYDNPQGPYPATAFEAQSWITTIDAADRTITAYDGIDWGFALSETSMPGGPVIPASAATAAAVPEPAGMTGWLVALLAVGHLRRRRASPPGRPQTA